MDKTKSSASSKHTSVRMVQNTLLIWLDGNIDEKSNDCRNTITEFRRVIDTLNTFTDGDECVQFIDGLNNGKAYMVVSGSLGQHIVPRIHNMPQVDSIFVFCGNKSHHEKWAKQWTKIKGIYTEVAPICKALKQTVEQSEQGTVPVDFVKTSGSGVSFGSLNQLDPSFMHTQILKEILLSIDFEQKHFKEFINYCRKQFVDNTSELKNIDKFEREYHNKTPIWWYTYECFLYRMVNSALRTMDMDILIKAGFFIRDLHHHIKQLHSEQFNGHHSDGPFMVYRGQGLSKVDFERMSKTVGGLMSFNNFLSTQKNRSVSLHFMNHATVNPDLVGILFVMRIDPSNSTAPFASIDGVNFFSQEDEVLFSTHTVFRIGEIKPIDGNDRHFQVELTLTSDTDDDLRMLTDHLRQEICQHSNGWYQLGLFLLKMGQIESAQHIYEMLLKETSDEREKGNLFHQLGSTKVAQDKYNEASKYFEKALVIYEKTLPPNHPHLASSLNNIGLVYEKMGEYSKALESHQKALRIYQKIRPPNHLDLVSTYNNMGLVYNDMGEYSKALSFHEKAFEIQQRTLPPNHPDLASSYNSIGLVYGNMREYSTALSSYERAVQIAQNSLPSNHPALKMYKDNLDAVKKKV